MLSGFGSGLICHELGWYMLVDRYRQRYYNSEIVRKLDSGIFSTSIHVQYQVYKDIERYAIALVYLLLPLYYVAHSLTAILRIIHPIQSTALLFSYPFPSLLKAKSH